MEKEVVLFLSLLILSLKEVLTMKINYKESIDNTLAKSRH